MGLWRSTKGALCIEVVSADLSRFLTEATKLGIVLQNVQFLDQLTLTAAIDRAQYKTCWHLTEKRGEVLRVLGKQGLYWHMKGLMFRPALLIVLGILLTTAVIAPRHIFFVKVEGNTTIPDRYILEQAETCGISFGAKRVLVRSEKIKNALVQSIPQLQWVGVTTKGCVATITVQEKTVTENTETPSAAVASIVAKHPGVISQITAVRGNLACKVGQAVKEGQVLISGYTDCGLSIRATQAEGEIYAQTLHTLTVATMSNIEERTDISSTQTRYSLRIGKKLIKLYKGSGISQGSCVKMYSEKKLCLPGGFELPITLIKEELVFYETDSAAAAVEDTDWLESAARDYLNSQMIAGQVLDEVTETTSFEEGLLLTGQYTCHEMIGILKQEEIMLPNGEND